MLTQDQINKFVQTAKSRGFNDQQINAEIERKKKELETPVSPIAPQPQPQVQSMDVSSPVFSQPKEQPVVQREKPTGIAGVFDSVSNFIFPRVNKLARKLTGSIVLDEQRKILEKSNSESAKNAQNFLDKAKKTNDPKLKQIYLQGAKDISARNSQSMEDILGGFEKSTGVSSSEMANQSGGNTFGERFVQALPEGLGAAGEVGTFFAPAGKLTKGASLGQKVMAGAKAGATVGAIQGVTDPTKKIDDLGGRVMQGLQDAGFGALAGGAFTAAYEVPKQIIKKALTGAPNILRGVFKIAPSEMKKFRAVNGMDFGEEILSRDGKSIAGMGYDEISDYMASKKDKAQEIVANALKGSTEVIDTGDLIKTVDEKIASLAPEKGNINTESAISTLNSIKETLTKNPKSLTLEVANNLKRQLQEAGSAAFSPNGKSTPSSSAFADVSGVLRKMIEEKAPGVKEGNKLIQLYHLATEAITKQGDAAVNRVASGNLQKFIQNIPAVGGAAVGFTVGGVPGGVAGIVGGEIISGLQGTIRNKMLSPEVQTRMASAVQSGLKNLKNPTTEQIKNVTDKVVMEMAKQLSRTVTLGSGSTQPTQEAQNQQLTTDNQTQKTQELQHENSINQSQMNINDPGFSVQESKKPTATGHTIAEHLQALSKATAAGDTEAVKAINSQLAIEQAFQKSGGTSGKSVPATQAQYLSDFDSAISVIDEVNTVLKENKGVFDPIVGKARSLNPYDVEAQSVAAVVLRASQVVGKALEGGVLRKEDEEKYKKMLPRVGDKLEVAKSKTEKVLEMLKKNRKQRVDALKKAGYDPEMIDFSGGTTGVTFENPGEY